MKQGLRCCPTAGCCGSVQRRSPSGQVVMCVVLRHSHWVRARLEQCHQQRCVVSQRSCVERSLAVLSDGIRARAATEKLDGDVCTPGERTRNERRSAVWPAASGVGGERWRSEAVAGVVVLQPSSHEGRWLMHEVFGRKLARAVATMQEARHGARERSTTRARPPPRNRPRSHVPTFGC